MPVICLRVGDAYAHSCSSPLRWVIGTKTFQLELALEEGQLRLVRLSNGLSSPPREYVSASSAGGLLPFGPAITFRLETQEAVTASEAGCQVLRLNLVLVSEGLRVGFHAQAYPETSVLRLWADIENEGPSGQTVPATLLDLDLLTDSGPNPTLSWMAGGYHEQDQGRLYQEAIGGEYRRVLETVASNHYWPMVVLRDQDPSAAGLLVALDYVGAWKATVSRTGGGAVSVVLAFPPSPEATLDPGASFTLPYITLCLFQGDLDDLGVRLYDWQYRYLWDYTRADYYARPRAFTWWFYCSRNLQEQFAARLANLNLIAEPFSEVGYEILWDDAGWSSYPGPLPPDDYGSVFSTTYEGPDFARTQRYLLKKGMKWLLWFSGLPSDGLLDTKVGAWGDFEWRTDAMPLGGLVEDRQLRQRIERFLGTHLESSFHTCSGGSTYSHNFEMHRYGTYHYQSDIGRGPYTNYYFSFLDTPDKCGDILQSFASVYGHRDDGSYVSMSELIELRQTTAPPALEDIRYVPQTARNALTQVPLPGLYATPEENELVRQDLEIYRFLRCEGVAGRWSYMFHPRVEGAEDYQFLQRTSHDRLRACLIPKCQCPGEVRLYPRGLRPEARYTVSFAVTPGQTIHSGAELMADGIALHEYPARELIFLNLAHHPGSGHAATAPRSPGSVYARRENNLGYRGVGLYWSPGADETWISGYEVRCDGELIARVSVGCYWFDHRDNWEQGQRYSVATVNGDGHLSSFRKAVWVAGEANVFEALGGHSPVADRDGWSAETTEDGTTFLPMVWVPPAKNPAADLGGTPNQPGGVEGYWEGAGQARVGRGWQQASGEAACVRAWTAPQAGRIRVVGRAVKEWYRQQQAGALQLRLLHNSAQIWPAQGPATICQDDMRGASHDVTLDVTGGDTLRFVLEKGSNPKGDILVWMPLVEYLEAPQASAESVVRIACGNQGPYLDSAGNRWEADAYFNGGSAVETGKSVEGAWPGEGDTALYQHGREGADFTYAIPVEPGLYTVRLKFAESRQANEAARPFHVEINGRRVLDDFDVAQTAPGLHRALDKAIHFVVPNAEDHVLVRFLGAPRHDGQTARAMVQAVEILPEFRPCLRLNAGSSESFIDWNSFTWAGDESASAGATLCSTEPLIQASPTLYDQPLYQTARCGREVSYTLSLPPGLYTVHLKFAELWLTELGQRAMDLEINGRTMRKAWDPATAAGQVGMACDLRELNITPNKAGTITICARAVGENEAILQGIEVE